MNYPLLSEYEIAIKKNGSQVLNLDERYEFVANRTAPIKFYNFGSGAFAGIFKVKNLRYQDFALRCFLNGGDPKRIARTKQITEFLSQIPESWVCKSKLFERGIHVKDNHFPTILMEWTSGKLINDYVSEIINFNEKITVLQEKLFALSQSLEKNGIAHGDIQSGNLLVEKAGNDIVLKLVDYDAMYIPTLIGQKSYEVGHSSFQHNRRTKDNFDEKIDRFSFWLLLTSLEALKFDKTLWNKDMSGGFNDGDNFLFRAKDIASPHASALVARLRNLRQPSVNHYLDNLLSNTAIPQRNEIKLYGAAKTVIQTIPKTEPQPKPITTETINSEQGFFQIDSDISNANIFLNSVNGLKLGTTPLKLDLSNASKLIFVEKNGVQKSFYLNKNEKNYYIKLTPEKKPIDQQENTSSTYQIFGEYGSKVSVSKAEIEEIFKSGRDLAYVFVQDKVIPLKEIPELVNIRNKYFEQKVEPEKEKKIPRPTTNPTMSNTHKSTNSLSWIIGIAMVVGLLIILLASGAFGKKKESVDLRNTLNSSAIASSEKSQNLVKIDANYHFPERDGYVTDYDLSLTTPQLINLNNLLEKYYLETSNEIVIVSYSRNLTSEEFDNFALALSNHWGVGTKEKNNGLTIIYSTKLHNIRISTGTGTEKILTDKICDDVLNQTILPEFRKNNYYEGLRNGVERFMKLWSKSTAGASENKIVATDNVIKDGAINRKMDAVNKGADAAKGAADAAKAVVLEESSRRQYANLPDSDGDGVPDKFDDCPTIAGSPKNNGCPWMDSDGDGILDKDDKCPYEYGYPEYNGCKAPR